MTRYLPLALLLASCTPAAQRDATLAVITTSAVATAGCGLALHDTGKGRACIVAGTIVTIGGGVVLHSLEEPLPQTAPAMPAGDETP